jgi:hypothetical protein
MPAKDDLSMGNENSIGKTGAIDSESILTYLTMRQHVNPHTNTGEILAQAVDVLGCCPQAIERALGWLQIEPTRPIGRLRRSELVQLSRAVHRFWMQNTAALSAAT